MSSSSSSTTRTTFLTTLVALFFISQIVLQLVAADPIPEAAPAPAPEPEPKKGGSAGAAAAGNRSAGTSIMSPEDGAVMMMTAVGTSVFTFLVSQLL